MSLGLNSPCHNCAHAVEGCVTGPIVQKAVELANSAEGFKAQGMFALICHSHDTEKPAEDQPQE